MGQLLSYLISLGVWPSAHPLPAPELTPARSSKRASPLIHLPADVLVLLCDYLDVPTALSLSLTCRSTYALCFALRQRKLRPEDKRQLLQLLERDPLARGAYYCHPCNKLHPFKATWGPRCEDEAVGPGQERFHCGNRDRFSPIGNPYELTYPHARLAMNRYLYGPDHGIPLKNLEVEHVQPHGATSIHCSTAASILDGELFIQRSYTFAISTDSIPDFRKCTGARDFRLCEHTSFFSNSSVYRQYIPELQRQAWAGGDAFVPCTDAPGSCGLCLMDYDITITPSSPDQATWTIAITAYHQLGECRSPEDWKWARFTEACRPHLFFPNRPNRRGSTHYPGVVKKRWLDGAAAALQPTPKPPVTTTEKKAAIQLTFPSAWFWL
jgi:hypothetical protein